MAEPPREPPRKPVARARAVVAPSVLACDLLRLDEETAPFEGERDLWLHLDVMDGHFVPNLTFAAPVAEGLARARSLPLDCHLMVENPGFHLDALARAAPHNVTLHLEACGDPAGIVRLVRAAKARFPSAGLALKPATPFSAVPKEVLPELDLLLVMSVEPGFAGQRFMPESLDKVREARRARDEAGLSFLIQIDGGIDGDTAPQAREAGCDVLVAGSHVFQGGPRSYRERALSLRGGA